MILGSSEGAAIKHERIVLVEGKGDLYVFENILTANNLSNEMQIIQIGGNTIFGNALERCRKKCRAVLVISDNDSDPLASFLNIQTQFEDAELKKPSAPFVSQIQTNGYLKYSDVYMIPAPNKVGALEDLCWEAFKTHYPHETACVETFTQCTKIDVNYAIHNRNQSRVEAILACIYPENPKQSLSQFGEDYLKNQDPPIFFTHPTFDTIRDYLISFSKV